LKALLKTVDIDVSCPTTPVYKDWGTRLAGFTHEPTVWTIHLTLTTDKPPEGLQALLDAGLVEIKRA